MLQTAFEQALERGKLAERRVFNVLAEAGWQVAWKPRGERRDIIATPPFTGGIQDRIEVKNEDNFEHRNNACVEFSQRGRPSGLATTEATVLIHTFGDKVLVCRVQPLRNWLTERLRTGKSTLVAVGDNDNRAVLEPQILIGMQTFADYIDFGDLPQSKVFKQ